MNYNEAVKNNLEHMGTPGIQWRPVPIIGMAETKDDKGNKVKMPEFEFPEGYTHAPSLYLCSNSSSCCELCGTPIKNLYYLQNDTHKWLLIVGSECVTHFGNLSGETLTKEFMWEQNRQLLRESIRVLAELKQRFSKRDSYGYLRWHNWPAMDVYYPLHKLVGDKRADSAFRRSMTSDAAITRWINTHGPAVRELLNDAYSFVEPIAA
jgi:hypothetical protein